MPAVVGDRKYSFQTVPSATSLKRPLVVSGHVLEDAQRVRTEGPSGAASSLRPARGRTARIRLLRLAVAGRRRSQRRRSPGRRGASSIASASSASALPSIHPYSHRSPSVLGFNLNELAHGSCAGKAGRRCSGRAEERSSSKIPRIVLHTCEHDVRGDRRSVPLRPPPYASAALPGPRPPRSTPRASGGQHCPSRPSPS